MKKIIIGLLGTANSGRTTVAKMLQKKGFYFVSINDKVAEFASHLFSKDELEKDRKVILNSIRRRGSSVNKEYWLNLILISIPDSAKYIVFDDISLDEANNNKVSVYQVYRPNVSVERLKDIETIENDGSIKNLSEKIEKLYKEFISQ
jgi:adenylate kinase family enzyme